MCTRFFCAAALLLPFTVAACASEPEPGSDAGGSVQDAAVGTDGGGAQDAGADMDGAAPTDASRIEVDAATMPTGAPVWVGVGNWGYRTSTRDGVTWTSVLNPEGPSDHSPDLLRGVGAGEGVFIAVGGDRNSMIMRSEDGVTWEEDLHPSGRQWLGAVAYFGGRWIAGGGVGTTVTSTDGGRTWTDGPRTPSAVRSIAAADGVFVAVGDGGMIATTTDGSAWTDRTRMGEIGLNMIAFHSGLWVAAGSSYNGSGFDTTCWTSSDTETWTACPFSLSQIRGVFVAGGALHVSHPEGEELTRDGASWEHSDTTVIRALGGEGLFVGTDGARRYHGPSLDALERGDDGERGLRGFTMGWVD